MSQSASEPPLKGVRVLELARILAGPWAGQLMGDLGAEVIKIERPEGGDDTRQFAPPTVKASDGVDLSGAYYHSCNRGKRSLAVDIATPEGQARVRALASGADVFIENYKVGGLRRYGLDVEALRAINPRLIYCSITGFGQDGPYAHRAGYDIIAQAMGGIVSMTGEPDRPPQKPGLAYADLFTGVYSTVAILAALERRHRTGEGAHIDMALLDTQVGVLSNQALNWMTTGKPPGRMGNGHAQLVPYQNFATLDGDVIIAVGNDGQFARMAELLGRPELAADPRFATNPARVTHRAALIPILEPIIAGWPNADLLDGLERAGVPAGPVNDVAQVFADPQVQARGMMIEVAEEGGDVLRGVATPIRIDGVRHGNGLAAPRLGGSPDADWTPR